MFLFGLLLIEGFIGLSIQMLMIRQLTPEVGASAVSSSWIIGFFLLSLAIGYKKGGENKRKPLDVLGDNLIKVALWAGVGLSSFFVMLLFQMGSSLSTLVLLILYCLLVVVPIAYWMGQSLPLLIQESKWGKNNAEISGNALYLSTIGSFLGAVVTTTVFLYFFGSICTLILISLVSLFVGVNLKFRSKSQGKSINFIKPLFFGALILVINIGFSSMMGMKGSQYADIFVVHDDKNNVTRLVANNTVMSKLKDGKNDTWYLKQFNSFVGENKLEGEEILVLGAGGFVAHLENPESNFIYVDIDPTLKEISENEFLKEKIKHKFVVSDARRYLIDNKKKHKLIFLDAFSSQRSIPSHLVTKEFFNLIRERLEKNGTLIVNTIINYEYKTDYSRRFHSTILSAFPFCKSLSLIHI